VSAAWQMRFMPGSTQGSGHQRLVRQETFIPKSYHWIEKGRWTGKKPTPISAEHGRGGTFRCAFPYGSQQAFQEARMNERFSISVEYLMFCDRTLREQRRRLCGGASERRPRDPSHFDSLGVRVGVG